MITSVSSAATSAAAVARSGRIEARSGLRMMPTFPRSPYHSVRRVFPDTAGRQAFQMAPSRMPRALKSAPDIRAVLPSLHPPFVHLVIQRLSHTEFGTRTRSCTAIKWNHHSYPRGPRSCPGYVVPDHHHLIDPIRPTRRHTAISPRSGLYAMSSLCGSAEATHEWFTAHSFLTCRPLRPRGVRTSHRPLRDADMVFAAD